MGSSDGKLQAQSCSTNGPEYYRASVSAGDIDKWDAQDLLARLYRSHTYREIRALADPERDLPGTMLPIDDAARGAAAHGYAKSAQVANHMLSGFVWRPHMRQHGPEIEGPSMSDGLGMWM